MIAERINRFAILNKSFNPLGCSILILITKKVSDIETSMPDTILQQDILYFYCLITLDTEDPFGVNILTKYIPAGIPAIERVYRFVRMFLISFISLPC